MIFTPDKFADTRKLVEQNTTALQNMVQIPSTTNTFLQAGNGWIDTSSKEQKPRPNQVNYPVFSVKWGPAVRVFSEANETSSSIEGKSHLYMYFGVDRLWQRASLSSDQEYINNMFSVNGGDVDFILFADVFEDTQGRINAWKKVLTPDMFEVNYAMQQGTSVNQNGTILPTSSSPTDYNGWVETPWSDYSNYPMVATYWKYCLRDAHITIETQSFPATGTVLVLSRSNFYFQSLFPNLLGSIDIDYVVEGTVNSDQMRLSEPLSECVTIFDEIPSGDVNTNQGIAQGHAGNLSIDKGHLDPFFAFRGHTFCDLNGQIQLVPGMNFPKQSDIYIDKGTFVYFSCNNLKFKGSTVYFKVKAATQNERELIEMGAFNWSTYKLTNPDTALYTLNLTQSNVLNWYLYFPYLDIVADQDNNFSISEVIYSARVVYSKQDQVYFFQFWLINNADPQPAPALPNNCVAATEWFQWTVLTKTNSPKHLLWTPIDNVAGTFDYTDTQPDSWYALSAYPSGRFLSLNHTSELSGGEGAAAGSGGTQALQLYKFNDLDYKKDYIEAEDQYLVRHLDNTGGALLQYAPLSSLLPEVDTRVAMVSADQNSIDYGKLSADSFLQLYKFPDNLTIDTKTALSDTTDVVLRHRYLKKPQNINVVEVEYLPVDDVINPVPDADTQGSKLFSISENARSPATNKPVWGLYKFSDQNYQCNLSDLTQGCAQFVIRNQWEDANTDAKVRYVPVDQVVAFPDKEGQTSKSIERQLINDRYELRLYNFLSASETYSDLYDKPTFKDLADDGYSVLIRDDDDGVGPQLKYFNLRYLSRYGDADNSNLGVNSIETENNFNEHDAPYFSLYGFEYPSVTGINFTLNYDGKAYHMTNNLSTAEDVQFVMRNALGGSKDVQYYDFTITAPKVGMSALTEEVINELTSSHCDCGPKWTYISAVIDDISAQVSSLSGEYWPQGGDSSTCYGSSIGNNRGSTVIDLDGASLDGVWSTGNNFYIGADLYIQNGSVYGTDYYGISYNAGCSIYADGYLTLGNTTLTEAQLIQLLRLV